MTLPNTESSAARVENARLPDVDAATRVTPASEQPERTPYPQEQRSKLELVRPPSPIGKTENGYVIFMRSRSKKQPIQVKEVPGDEYRVSTRDSRPRVLTGGKTDDKAYHLAFPIAFQERFSERWAQSDGETRELVLFEAINFAKSLERTEQERDNLAKQIREAPQVLRDRRDPENRKKAIKLLLEDGQFTSAQAANKYLGVVMERDTQTLKMMRDRLSALHQYTSQFEAGPFNPETVKAPAQAFPEGETFLNSWPTEESMAEKKRAREQIEKERQEHAAQHKILGRIGDKIIERNKLTQIVSFREARSDDWDVLKVDAEYDHGVELYLIPPTRQGSDQTELPDRAGEVSLREPKTSTIELENIELLSGKVGKDGAEQVKKAKEEAAATSGLRFKFAPRFLLERFKGALSLSVSEYIAAKKFSRATEEIAHDYLDAVSAEQMPSSLEELRAQKPSGPISKEQKQALMDDALGQLRERLGKMRAFSGDLLEERIAAAEASLTATLEEEIDASTGIVYEHQAEALAAELRKAIDARYWYKYVAAPIELAVGSVFWLKAVPLGIKAGVKAATRPLMAEAAAPARKAVAEKIQSVVARQYPMPELDLLKQPEVVGGLDQTVLDGTIWHTAKNALMQAGVEKPSAMQTMTTAYKIAQKNGIAVSAWGLKGKLSDVELPFGAELKGVREIVKEVMGAV